MMKYIVLVLLLIPFFTVAPLAFASVCRNYDGQQICILNINRSAKNYWEYRAAVSVNGVKRPIEVYNCREQVKVKQDGTILPFEQKDPGRLICSFFNSSGR
ncbi:hypothetical protein WKK05_16595 [Nostoc sp. UHCC 0302]|uniref:hypothetical protein n=1 Tax=Nostoc sp. UHCC 0302 TaxID=3134896 RepID=UPI00311CA0B2